MKTKLVTYQCANCNGIVSEFVPIIAKFTACKFCGTQHFITDKEEQKVKLRNIYNTDRQTNGLRG